MDDWRIAQCSDFHHQVGAAVLLYAVDWVNNALTSIGGRAQNSSENFSTKYCSFMPYHKIDRLIDFEFVPMPCAQAQSKHVCRCCQSVGVHKELSGKLQSDIKT